MSEILNLPKGHAVLQSSTVELPLQKAKFRIHKIYDEGKDNTYQLAFNEKQRKVDFDRALKKEIDLQNQRYGKIHPTLFDMLQSKQKAAKFEVVIWLNASVQEPFKTQFNAKELSSEKVPSKIAASRSALIALTGKVAAKVSKEAGIELKGQIKLAPAFITEATIQQVNLLASLREVSLIALYERKGIDDLQDSLDISNGQQVVYTDGNRGNNIKVAVWERGPDNTSDLVIEARYDSTPSTSAHARLTTGIIKNNESAEPNGYAPSCKIYSANDYDNDALEWAVEEKNCRVVSQSFHRESEETSGTLSADDILKDYLVMRYPYPTITQAAGNISVTNEFVNHKGYNSLAIGSHNDSATAMASDSTFRNPTSDHGDRELPELSANGTNVTAVGLTNSGTSFAAPAAAGSAAVLMGIDSLLKSWPEGIRAILLAGATRNVRGRNWRQDLINNVDARDGAGALDLRESARIARKKKSPGNTASQCGYDVGRLESRDFRTNGIAKNEYHIQVPRKGPTHVKVALAWDAKVLTFIGIRLGSFLTMDLDLRIYKGSQLVAHSSSWDNSYEIAEYDAKPGDVLTVKIKRYSGNDWTYFGLAWNVF